MSRAVKVSDHAYKELQLLDDEIDVTDGYLEVVKAFTKLADILPPNDGSIENAINILNALFRGENVTPLTDDPQEWDKIPSSVENLDLNLWENNRNPNAYSQDGGKTYYLLRKNGVPVDFPVVMRTSVPSQQPIGV